MKKLIYTNNNDKERLDVYLAEKLNKSRNQIQKLIKSDLVLINNKPAKVHTFLKENDEIVIEKKTSELKEKNYEVASKQVEKTGRVKAGKKTFLQKIKSRFYKKEQQTVFKTEPKVITETNDYIILEKPAGMLVHPTLRNEPDTLVDWLLQNHPQVKGVGEDPARPGLVHRLDKEVSGLMVIAKNLDSFDNLKKQFKLRTTQKYYLALVHGVIDKDAGSIDFNITRSKSGKYVALPIGSTEGKDAHTEFEVLQRYNNYTLVKVKILTGRTNQIRIHFNALGHPLVGDDLYMSNKIKDKSKISLNRVFLHAASLSFTDLNDEKQHFESPLPTNLQNILDNLK